MAAAGVPTARARRLHDPGRGGRRAGRVRAAVRRQGRRPRGRQGRGGHRRPRRGAGARGGLRRGWSIEEYLDGPEVSLFAITDGTTVVPLPPAQDFKRVCDGDAGPNTGGMGAYSPLPWAPDGLVEEVLRDVLQPTVDEMARRGTPFAGLLYAGLALTSRGVRVIEFNARFGDPETQVVLARLRHPARRRAARRGHRRAGRGRRRWSGPTARRSRSWWPRTATPSAPRTGDVIDGLDAAAEVDGVARAARRHRARRATARGGHRGGRVLVGGRTGADRRRGPRARRTRRSAGSALDGAHHRTDIAARPSSARALDDRARGADLGRLRRRGPRAGPAGRRRRVPSRRCMLTIARGGLLPGRRPRLRARR